MENIACLQSHLNNTHFTLLNNSNSFSLTPNKLIEKIHSSHGQLFNEIFISNCFNTNQQLSEDSNFHVYKGQVLNLNNKSDVPEQIHSSRKLNSDSFRIERLYKDNLGKFNQI
jgi:hypothetical protein